MEEWRDVKDYEGLYQVSNLGRVRTFRYADHRVRSQYRHKKYNYWQILLQRKGLKKKTAKVHRLVAQAFLPNPHNLPEVNHLDCDRLNNRVENLEWCDRRRNMEHAGQMGRMRRDQRGEKNANFKHGRNVGKFQKIQGKTVYIRKAA